VSVGLKWPNDLVAGGGKLGGILCQSRVSGDSAWVIVGLGVNLQAVPPLDPDAGRAACLAELGWSGETGPACWRLASAFVAALRPALADAPHTLASWSRRSVHVVGELMQVQLGGKSARGRFTGFGPRGELLLEVGGSVRAIGAGSLVTALEP
jgi:BirA family biotin operon repressor/biotin-[acetyl-CoA-carboxylase] ligase